MVGKWAIEKEELCLYFKGPDDGCYEVSLSGDRIEMKPPGLGLTIDGFLQIPTDRDWSYMRAKQLVLRTTDRMIDRAAVPARP